MAWPLIAMAGMQVVGGMANRSAAKKTQRKNAAQAERDRTAAWYGGLEGQNLFGHWASENPELTHFQLSKLSDERLEELAREHGIEITKSPRKYRKRRGGIGGMLGRTKTAWSAPKVDRDDIIGKLMGKRGLPERAMFREARGRYDEAGKYLGADKYENLINMFSPMQAAAMRAGKGIFDDTLTKERLGFYDPVHAARQQVVDTQKQALEEGLQDTLGAQGAAQRRRGFSGDSLAQLRMTGESRKGASTGIAKLQALMELANKSDALAENMKGQQMKVSNLNLPSDLAAAEGRFQMTPLATSSQAEALAQAPLQFFKQRPNVTNLPPSYRYQQIPTSAEILSKGVGTLAGGLMQQQAQTQYLGAMKDIAAMRMPQQQGSGLWGQGQAPVGTTAGYKYGQPVSVAPGP